MKIVAASLFFLLNIVISLPIFNIFYNKEKTKDSCPDRKFSKCSFAGGNDDLCKQIYVEYGAKNHFCKMVCGRRQCICQVGEPCTK